MAAICVQKAVSLVHRQAVEEPVNPPFPLGQVVATPAALKLVPPNLLRHWLQRHQAEDWGAVGGERYICQKLNLHTLERIEPQIQHTQWVDLMLVIDRGFGLYSGQGSQLVDLDLLSKKPLCIRKRRKWLKTPYSVESTRKWVNDEIGLLEVSSQSVLGTELNSILVTMLKSKLVRISYLGT